MPTVAIIPARGGSKGIPNKNLQPIGGIPLVGWAVRAALGAKSVDAVYVSTDSTAIAKVAEEYGATVIHRPKGLGADEAGTLPVIRDALEQMDNEPDVVVVMQCTSPLTTSEDVDWAMERLTDTNDGVISVVEDHGLILSREGRLLTYSAEEREQRRQDREPRYRINGSLFIMRNPLPDKWPNRVSHYVMPAARSVDIDDPLDLHIAEALLRYSKAWIVLGAGPDAREMLAIARARYPNAMIVTTNEGINLFELPDKPDVYVLADGVACQVYHDQAKAIQQAGTRLVTLRRDISALKQRRVDHFDQFVPVGAHNIFARGGYSAGLSGLLCLEYAINNGAKQIHMIGMNGYTGRKNGDYFDGHEPVNTGRKRHMHTEVIIQPFTQAAIDGCPDIEFVVYGKLNYSVSGPNVRRFIPRKELTECV